MPTYSVHVTASGPLFDGEAAAAARQVVVDAQRDLAEEGAGILRSWPMDKSGRAHGAFQEHIQITTTSRGLTIPGPMIKGTTWAPWLEGTSKRNTSTGFGGYHLFRKTAARLRTRAREVLQKRLDEFIGRMGGR